MTGTVSARWGFVDDSALNYMVDRISAGQCILFVGAGLAQTCEDDHGINWDNSTLLDMSQSNSMTITIGGLIERNLPFSATQAVSQGRLGNVRYET